MKPIDETIRRMAQQEHFAESEDVRARLDHTVDRAGRIQPGRKHRSMLPVLAACTAVLALVVLLAGNLNLLRPAEDVPANQPMPTDTLAPLNGSIDDAPLTYDVGGITFTPTIGYTDAGQLVFTTSMVSQGEQKFAMLWWHVYGMEEDAAWFGDESTQYLFTSGEEDPTANFTRVWPDKAALDRALTITCDVVMMDVQHIPSAQQLAAFELAAIASDGRITAAQAAVNARYGSEVITLTMPMNVKADAVDLRQYGIGTDTMPAMQVGRFTTSDINVQWRGADGRLTFSVTNTSDEQAMFSAIIPAAIDAVGYRDLYSSVTEYQPITRVLAAGETLPVTMQFMGSGITLFNHIALRITDQQDAGVSGTVAMLMMCGDPEPSEIIDSGTFDVPGGEMTFDSGTLLDAGDGEVTWRVMQTVKTFGRSYMTVELFSESKVRLLRWRSMHELQAEASECGAWSVEQQLQSVDGGWRIKFMFLFETEPKTGVSLVIDSPEHPLCKVPWEAFTAPLLTTGDTNLAMTVYQTAYDAEEHLVLEVLVRDVAHQVGQYLLGFTVEGLPEDARAMELPMAVMNILPGEEGDCGRAFKQVWAMAKAEDLQLNVTMRAWRLDGIEAYEALTTLTPETAAADDRLTLVSELPITIDVSAADKTDVHYAVGDFELEGIEAEGLKTSGIQIQWHGDDLSVDFDLTNTGDAPRTVAWFMGGLSEAVETGVYDGSTGEDALTLAPGETRHCAAQLTSRWARNISPQYMVLVLNEDGSELAHSQYAALYSDVVWKE